MIIVFHSNFMNHHQYGLCKEMLNQNVTLYFVENDSLPDEQRKLGYHTYDDDFIIKLSDANRDTVYDLTMSADAVIFGSKPVDLYHKRVDTGKLSFNFSERFFKKSKLQAIAAPFYFSLKKKYIYHTENAPFILCAGSYVGKDYARLGYPKDRFLKWGYFPNTPMNDYRQLAMKKEKNTMIWVGRFISWKHPEYVIELAERLRRENRKFHIKMIGTGELFEEIRQRINRLCLDDVVELTGSMCPEDVLQAFECAEIALITSDRNEGWGAVVNEAMASACATVACAQIGSVSYLMRRDIDGFIYKRKSEFFNDVIQLLDHEHLREKISESAYYRIKDLWNYKTAASRLITFINNQEVYTDDGPLSKG